MFSKRKGRSEWGFNRKLGYKGANVEASVAGDNRASKEGSGTKGGRWRKKAGHVQGGRRSSSSNSDNGRKSSIRTRRRRRRRMRARQNQEGHREPRKTKGHRKSKPKHNVKTTKETVWCSESSWSGSHSYNDRLNVSSSNQSYYSNASRMEYFELPWANLDMPMDLSQVELEVKNSSGVDFELLAQKNHQRWCANLVKAKEWVGIVFSQTALLIFSEHWAKGLSTKNHRSVTIFGSTYAWIQTIQWKDSIVEN